MSTEKNTEFQGATSLDAIFAAVSKNNVEEPLIKEPIKVENKEVIEEKIKPEVKVGTEVKKEEPIVKPQVEEAKPVDATIEETQAYLTAKRLLKLGLLEDFAVQISDEDEQGTPISEFKSMSDENLEEILKIHKQDKDEEISKKFIPKDNLKEHQLKVIEILRNGGDLSSIADTPEKAMERPFEGFDMDDQERQVDVRYTDLVHNKGLDHENAMTIIKSEVSSGKLKEKAEATFNQYREAHERYIDEKLVAQKKDKEFKDLNFKENKKVLTAKLKEAGLKESVYKKVTSEYEKKDSNGEFNLVNKLREALNNPEENHELILHLSDKKLFNEAFKIKTAGATAKAIVKLNGMAGKQGNKVISKTTDVKAVAPWEEYAEKFNQNLKRD